jgi:DNA-directed RNA polymerase
MLVKPTPYSCSNKFGGYLTNGHMETQELVINKTLYRNSSVINEQENFVYKAINTISQCPFTINTKVLQFLLNYGKD